MILSGPPVTIEPGVFSAACHVHSKSSQVIGEPSSQTASGLMSIVMVIAASPDGCVPPVSPVVVPGSVPGDVVACSLAGGEVADSVPGAVAGAVVPAAPPSSSSPQAAATATSDRPAAKAKSRLVRLMLLTSSPPHRMNGRE